MARNPLKFKTPKKPKNHTDHRNNNTEEKMPVEVEEEQQLLSPVTKPAPTKQLNIMPQREDSETFSNHYNTKEVWDDIKGNH